MKYMYKGIRLHISSGLLISFLPGNRGGIKINKPFPGKFCTYKSHPPPFLQKLILRGRIPQAGVY